MTREEAIEYLDKLYMQAEITDEYGDLDDTEPYETAIEIATEALRQPEQKWIPFKQEQNSDTGLWEWVNPLPKDGQHILVSIALNGYEPVHDDYFFEDGSGLWLDSGYEIGADAVAWMPLPEPYQEDTP